MTAEDQFSLGPYERENNQNRTRMLGTREDRKERVMNKKTATRVQKSSKPPKGEQGDHFGRKRGTESNSFNRSQEGKTNEGQSRHDYRPVTRERGGLSHGGSETAA